MSRKSKIVLATNNPGKTDEINRILRDTDVTVVSQVTLGIEEAIEDKPTFVENALIKARHASAVSGLPAIADDSGLEVDALNGKPGVISSRYYGEGANDERNIRKLLTKLENVSDQDRSCRFRCVMVFLRHELDASPLISEGVLPGYILKFPRGSNGFGYDPVFWLPQQQCTLAELDPVAKNKVSHRGRALRKLVTQLIENKVI